jgi:hypothetical protein
MPKLSDYNETFPYNFLDSAGDKIPNFSGGNEIKFLLTTPCPSANDFAPSTFDILTDIPQPKNKHNENEIDSPLQKEYVENQKLIISMLQEVKKDNSEHHAVAATKKDVEDQTHVSMQHTSEQFDKMTATISKLEAYIDSYSPKRTLTKYSLILLFISCAALAINIFHGPFTIRSPLPEFAALISICLLLMARFASTNKKI